MKVMRDHSNSSYVEHMLSVVINRYFVCVCEFFLIFFYAFGWRVFNWVFDYGIPLVFVLFI